jgi:hypothetical protein
VRRNSERSDRTRPVCLSTHRTTFPLHSLERRARSSGLDSATATAQIAAIQHSQQLYQNPFVNMAYTFIEPFPVGLIITLVSAAVLRRKAPVDSATAPSVMTT